MSKKVYPTLDDEGRIIHRTVECQSDPESPYGSPKATSTPILNDTLSRKTALLAKAVDETILAGNAGRRLSNYYFLDNSHTNSSIIHSVLAPSEYQRTFEDFRECCTTGDWWHFILRHHLRILFIICLVMVLWSVWTAFHPIGVNRQEMWKNYRQELLILRKEYPGLTKADENTLLVVGQQWIIDAKSEPVVLTLGGPNSSPFAEKLFKILVKISKGQTSRGVIGVNSSTQRGQLHELVKSELSRNTPAVAAIRSIDRLSWDAPLVIHAYSDSDSSPIPNTFLVLSVEDGPDPRSCEQGLAGQLTTKWMGSGGTEDNVPPIISRILGYTICL